MKQYVIGGCAGMMLLFATGCVTPVMNVTSVEVFHQDAMSMKSRIAILPEIGKLNSCRQSDLIKQGEALFFLDGENSSSGMLRSADVAAAFLQQPNLRKAQTALAGPLLDIPMRLIKQVGDSSGVVDTKKWDGHDGLKYASLAKMASYTPNGKGRSQPTSASVKLQWSLSQRLAFDATACVDGPAAKELADGLGCRYLLVPVAVDAFTFRSHLLTFFFIPFGYKYHLYHDEDIVMVLVDGQTSRVINAIRTQGLTPFAVAASMARVIGGETLMGRLNVITKQPAKEMRIQ